MDPRPFDVDPDIRNAASLPGSIYGSAELHARVVERVFARSWQLVRGAERVTAPDHVLPFTLLEGSLDEPLLFVGADRGRCLSNVCTHRGALVCEAEARVTHLRCRYHGRRFALDGRLTGMPEFEGVAGFPSPSDDLPALPVGRLGPLAFTGLAPRIAFADWIAPVVERVGFLPLDRLEHDPTTSRDYELDANWALYVDNYLEELHIPFVHPTLNATLDYATYRTETFATCSLQLGTTEDPKAAFAVPAGHRDAGTLVAAWYWWLFPNLMLNFYPWGLSVNVVEPLGPLRTRVRFLSYVLDPSRRDHGAGADLHRVEMEDEAVVESVQKGVRSRLYSRGRYSPRREVGTHHFHRLLVAALRD